MFSGQSGKLLKQRSGFECQEHSHDRGHMAAAEELWRRAECPKTIAAPRALQSIAGLARNLCPGRPIFAYILADGP